MPIIESIKDASIILTPIEEFFKDLIKFDLFVEEDVSMGLLVTNSMILYHLNIGFIAVSK